MLSYWRHVEAEQASARQVITSLVALLNGRDDPMDTPQTLDISLADLIAALYDDLPRPRT